MPEGLRLANEGLRLANEGLRLAGFMKCCVMALWCYRVVFTGWFLQGSVPQGGMFHTVWFIVCSTVGSCCKGF